MDEVLAKDINEGDRLVHGNDDLMVERKWVEANGMITLTVREPGSWHTEVKPYDPNETLYVAETAAAHQKRMASYTLSSNDAYHENLRARDN